MFSSKDTAVIPVNIKSSFLSGGIFPLDRSIFSKQDFLCSAVTDRPLEGKEEQRENFSDKIFETASISTLTSVACPNSNTLIPDPQNQTKETKFLSPEGIRPYSMVSSHDKTSKKKRKKRITIIATDTK